jgi:hypothetical protein
MDSGLQLLKCGRQRRRQRARQELRYPWRRLGREAARFLQESIAQARHLPHSNGEVLQNPHTVYELANRQVWTVLGSPLRPPYGGSLDPASRWR